MGHWRSYTILCPICNTQSLYCMWDFYQDKKKGKIMKLFEMKCTNEQCGFNGLKGDIPDNYNFQFMYKGAYGKEWRSDI